MKHKQLIITLIEGAAGKPNKKNYMNGRSDPPIEFGEGHIEDIEARLSKMHAEPMYVPMTAPNSFAYTNKDKPRPERTVTLSGKDQFKKSHLTIGRMALEGKTAWEISTELNNPDSPHYNEEKWTTAKVQNRWDHLNRYVKNLHLYESDDFERLFGKPGELEAKRLSTKRKELGYGTLRATAMGAEDTHPYQGGVKKKAEPRSIKIDTSVGDIHPYDQPDMLDRGGTKAPVHLVWSINPSVPHGNPYPGSVIDRYQLSHVTNLSSTDPMHHHDVAIDHAERLSKMFPSHDIYVTTNPVGPVKDHHIIAKWNNGVGQHWNNGYRPTKPVFPKDGY